MKILISMITLFFSLSAVAEITTTLEEKLASDGSADIILYLKAKANLSLAPLIIEKNARTQYVYTSLVNTAQNSQRDLISFLDAKQINYRSFYIENAIAIKNANRDLIISLLSQFEIANIGLDAAAKLELPKVEANFNSAPAHLQLIAVDKVWQEFGIKGKGIVVAGQDTGYFWQHNAIKKQYRGYNDTEVEHDYNWHDAILSNNTNCKGSSIEPCDDNGHGTHTMGTILGFDGGKNQIGVAPEAKWIGCRNMNRGVGTVSTYLSCFEFFLAPYPVGGDPQRDGKPELAPHIVNNSWSCPKSEGCVGGEFLDSIRALKAAGIAVVVAAGNDGPSCDSIINPPSYYTNEVLIVGAYNRWTKDIAIFSSIGPSAWDGGLAPNVIAPGTLIRSALHNGVNSYSDKSGTSMASPHVAGLIALMWSAKPELIGQVDETIDIIQKTATPMARGKTCGPYIGGSVPNVSFGHGMINAYEAIKYIQ